MEAVDLGALKKIRIGHDNDGIVTPLSMQCFQQHTEF